ncbi:MAG: hypothetical protein PVG32_14985 [Anaerolineales bacterium]|jgi:hypothetical protein
MGRKKYLLIVGIISGIAWIGLSKPEPASGLGQKRNSATERKILASTLRIKIETWIIYIEGQGYTKLASSGHGTVMDGRYLVTHNHFRVPLVELLDTFDSEFATVTLYRAGGQQLWQGTLKVADVAVIGSETLVLEFVDENGGGLFESLGVPSAVFTTLSSQPIEEGMEVAQINWDKNTAYVQWTRVESIDQKGDTTVMELSSCLVPGSSGGGVFVNGVHIANNWSRSIGCGESASAEIQPYSLAALNTTELVATSQ